MPDASNVIVHAFNWNYRDVAAHADEFRQCGYRFVLVSPPSLSNGGAWWGRYQPRDYRVVRSPLGNKADFVSMISAVRAQGLGVLVDVVLNHMANEPSRPEDLTFPGAETLAQYAADPTFGDDKLFGDLSHNLFSDQDFNLPFCIFNWNDAQAVRLGRICGEHDTGLPDLKSNDWVIQQQRNYLFALKNLGIEGFRVDAAKHLPTSHLNAVFGNGLADGMFVFGEVIDSEFRRAPPFIEDYVDQTNHCAMDFPLHNTLVSAFRPGGSLSALRDPELDGHALPKFRAVTFTVTHDIPNNSTFRGLIMDRTDEHLAYAYLLGRDGGVPAVYSDHGESDGLFTNNWKDAFRREDLVAMIRFHNAVQGTTMDWLADDDCYLVFRREHLGLVSINKCDTQAHIPISTQGLLPDRTYRDVLSGNELTFPNHQHVLVTPARSAQLWLLQDL